MTIYRYSIFLIILLLVSFVCNSQNLVTGRFVEKSGWSSGFVTVTYGSGGTVTDFNGEVMLNLPDGENTLFFSSFGTKKQKIVLKNVIDGDFGTVVVEEKRTNRVEVTPYPERPFFFNPHPEFYSGTVYSDSWGEHGIISVLRINEREISLRNPNAFSLKISAIVGRDTVHYFLPPGEAKTNRLSAFYSYDDIKATEIQVFYDYDCFIADLEYAMGVKEERIASIRRRQELKRLILTVATFVGEYSDEESSEKKIADAVVNTITISDLLQKLSAGDVEEAITGQLESALRNKLIDYYAQEDKTTKAILASLTTYISYESPEDANFEDIDQYVMRLFQLISDEAIYEYNGMSFRYVDREDYLIKYPNASFE